MSCRAGSRLLTGKELVENGAKKGNITLPNKGSKNTISNGTWLEKKQIENCLESNKLLLQDQRIEKRDSLSHANWIHKMEKAHVIKKKGPYWSYIGHIQDNKTYILPEEALYLLEIGALLLKFGGVIISVQQAYYFLLGKSISFDEYRVYTTLSKEGYRLVRHNEESYSNINLNNIHEPKKEENKKRNLLLDNVDIINVNKKNIEKVFESTTEDDNISATVNNMDIIENNIIPLSNDNKHDNCKNNNIISYTSDDSNDCVMLCDGINNSHDITINERLKRKNNTQRNELEHNMEKIDVKHVDNDINIIEIDNSLLFKRQKILNSIVDCFNKKNVNVVAPDKTYVPPNINLQRKNYSVNIKKISFNDTKRNITSNRNRYHCINSEYTSKHFLNKMFNKKSLANQPLLNEIYPQIYRFNSKQQHDNVNFFPILNYDTNHSYFPTTSNQKSTIVNQNLDILNENSTSQFDRQSSFNPNPYSSVFCHKRRREKRHRNSNIQNISESDSDTDNSVAKSNHNKNAVLLKKLKDALSYVKMTELKNDDKTLKKILPLIEEYNEYFDCNYKLNEEVLRLNCQIEPNLDKNVCNEIMSSQNSFESESKISDNVPLTTICEQLNLKQKEFEISRVKLDNVTLSKDWYSKNDWSEPKIVSSKSKQNIETLKLTMAFFNGIKQFTDDEKNRILSWKQAKNLYENKKMQYTTFVNDDNDSNCESNEKQLFSNISVQIKVNKVKPLIRPQNCKSVASVLSRLQITKPYNESFHELDNKQFKILFDVYMPSKKNFKKSSLSLPAYCIIMCSDISSMPSPKIINTLRLKIPKCIKIIYAIVSTDSVFFLQMENVELPTMID